jgi:hypothetical protein
MNDDLNLYGWEYIYKEFYNIINDDKVEWCILMNIFLFKRWLGMKK